MAGKNKQGLFVISLDFELLWGVFDKVDPEQKKTYFQNTKKIIPDILDIFEENEIHATWAIVGMLFNKDWQEWQENVPEVLPEYDREELSAYSWSKGKKGEDLRFMLFDRTNILRIKETPGQEIGTHTYSHYYCLEKGQTISAFRSDLERAIKVAKDFDIKLRSLVFPRNQFNAEYLQVCHELGIQNVRSNPTDWYWKNTQKDSLITKIFRTGDAYFGPNNKSYRISRMQMESERPLTQRASRLLRPYTENSILNSLKLKRVKSEMIAAAKKGEIYHLWWHPHNFGNHPEQNLNDLKELLKCFKYCSEVYGFKSVNMGEVRDFVNA